MTLTLWLGTYLLHSTVLGGSVLVFRKTLRRRDGAEQLWRAAMLLPIISATMAQASGLGFEIPLAGGQSMASVLAAPPNGSAPSWDRFDVANAATLVCFAIGALMVVRDRIAHALFIRRLGPRTPASPEIVRQVRDLLCDGAGQPIALTCAPQASSAMLLGRREVCLPARAEYDLTPVELRALVAHEVAHALRRDGLWFQAIAAIESALFIQPLNRIGGHELRHLAELSCDAWAARRIANPEAVARCLLEVAAWSQPNGAVGVPGAASSNRGLSERVQRLIEPPASHVRVALWPCVVTLFLASLALPGLAVQALAQHSADYQIGYELGRAYAARHGVQPSDLAKITATAKQRQELERRLIAAQPKK